MRACRKYWLIAVSSLNSTLFRCWMTFGSPFMPASVDVQPFEAERCGGASAGVHPPRLWGQGGCRTPPPKPTQSPDRDAPARISSDTLLGVRREVIILHAGREYLLRVTQHGRLILTA